MIFILFPGTESGKILVFGIPAKGTNVTLQNTLKGKVVLINAWSKHYVIHSYNHLHLRAFSGSFFSIFLWPVVLVCAIMCLLLCVQLKATCCRIPVDRWHFVFVFCWQRCKDNSVLAVVFLMWGMLWPWCTTVTTNDKIEVCCGWLYSVCLSHSLGCDLIVTTRFWLSLCAGHSSPVCDLAVEGNIMASSDCVGSILIWNFSGSDAKQVASISGCGYVYVK